MKIFQKLLPFVIVLSLVSCNSGNFYIIPFKRYIVGENGMYPSIEPKNVNRTLKIPQNHENKIPQSLNKRQVSIAAFF